jgi:hypothetical protein
MCKISLAMYHRMSSSEDKIRMRPDFHVTSAPSTYSAHAPTESNANADANANAKRMTHSSKLLSFSDEFDGPTHYITTYNKTTQPCKYNDSGYETTQIDYKCVKSDSSVNLLVKMFVDNGFNRFAGQTALRKLFKLLNVSGNGAITHSELKKSLNLIGIWVQNESDYTTFYNMMACEPDNLITYMSFKTFMDAQCEFLTMIHK